MARSSPYVPPMLPFPSVTFHSGQDSCPGLKHIHSSVDPQTAPNPVIFQSHWDRGVEIWDTNPSLWPRPAWVFYTILTTGWFDCGHNGIFTSHRLGSVHMLITQVFPFPTDHQSNGSKVNSDLRVLIVSIFKRLYWIFGDLILWNSRLFFKAIRSRR